MKDNGGLVEKTYKIKTKDKKVIYGTLFSKGKSDSLLVFVHGLTGHQNEHYFYNGARFFAGHGIHTFRFNLYDGEKNGRRLIDCSISTHAKDLATVLDLFSKKYEKIYVVGHSLGGPSVLLSDLSKVNAAILWDPSISLSSLARFIKYDKRTKSRFLDWGVQYYISEDMVNEWKGLDARMLEAINLPVKFIFAEKGILEKKWKKTLEKIKSKKEVVKIKNATHCFDEEGTEESLFKETLSWIRKN
jgi:pimeloyl-ACP methyl ester carboxylesterase